MVVRKIYFLLFFVIIFAGCASGKTVLVNLQKTSQEIDADKKECQAVVDRARIQDEELKAKKLDQCLSKKGYKPVAEKEVGQFKGFKSTWVNPDVHFDVYEAIFIDDVDVSQVKVKNAQIASSKVTEEDIDNLGKEMFERFSKILNAEIPVAKDKESLAGKKAMVITLALRDIAFTNVGVNAALQAVGQISRLPVPVNSQGLFSFEGVIVDSSNGEKLMIISDESKADKNASLAGFENFEKWKHAYNTMDYWADRLGALLAAKRGETYKSQLKMKLVDF